MDFLGPRYMPGNVHTEILFDDGGTVEIYHPVRQATETGQCGIGETF
jgi:hypothetical protein